jgi:hypothetical protein
VGAPSGFRTPDPLIKSQLRGVCGSPSPSVGVWVAQTRNAFRPAVIVYRSPYQSERVRWGVLDEL